MVVRRTLEVFVLDVPRNENGSDVRTVKFERKIGCCHVLVVKDLMKGIPTQCEAQVANCRCGGGWLIRGVS